MEMGLCERRAASHTEVDLAQANRRLSRLGAPHLVAVQTTLSHATYGCRWDSIKRISKAKRNKKRMYKGATTGGESQIHKANESLKRRREIIIKDFFLLFLFCPKRLKILRPEYFPSKHPVQDPRNYPPENHARSYRSAFASPLRPLLPYHRRIRYPGTTASTTVVSSSTRSSLVATDSY